jgi:hypothetical protein
MKGAGEKMRKEIEMLSIGMLCFCLCACVQNTQTQDVQESETEQYEEFTWPSEGITSMLPVPESTTGKIYTMDEQILTVYVSNTYATNFRKYIRECQTMGFDVDVTSNESRYSAYNENGTHLVLSFDATDFVMRIDLTVSKQDQQHENETVQTPDEESVQVVAQSEDVNDFQNDMDNYEDFFLEYCNFMRSYDASEATQNMKKQYNSYQSEKQEKLNALDEIGQSDLSEEKQEIYDTAMKHINRLIEMAQY